MDQSLRHVFGIVVCYHYLISLHAPSYILRRINQ